MNTTRNTKIVAILIIAITSALLIISGAYMVAHADATMADNDVVYHVIEREQVTLDTALVDDNESVLVKFIDVDYMGYIMNHAGDNTIDIFSTTLIRFSTPDELGIELDYSTFQPFMDYRCITAEGTQAYDVSHSEKAYTDENGMRRYKLNPGQFSIDGQDDYVFALGTFYKPKGECGDRWLVITSTGAYTATTGDEKADSHTDELHMYSSHGEYAGLIEWLVDTDYIDQALWTSGSVTAGPVEAIKGDIQYIYRIG